jgi:hypothetical protein
VAGKPGTPSNQITAQLTNFQRLYRYSGRQQERTAIRAKPIAELLDFLQEDR